MYEYKAKIVNIVDGDTFDLEIDLGFRIFSKVRVRLLGIDTPEKRGPERELGLICTEYAKRQFLGRECIIKSEKAAEDVDTDSFGRWLVWLTLDTGIEIAYLYNALGINKLYDTYSEKKVRELV